MKAAILETFGSLLSIGSLPDPVLGSDEVIVDVVAAGVLPYMAEVLSGERKYLLTLPAAPGAEAIGRVQAVGPDPTRLAVGDWVSCRCTRIAHPARIKDVSAAPKVTEFPARLVERASSTPWMTYKTPGTAWNLKLSANSIWSHKSTFLYHDYLVVQKYI